MTRLRRATVLWIACMLAAVAAGCQSPYFADRGAGMGALGGAGVGALVGNAVGDTAAGALIGAGVGAIGGAAVGSAIDEAQARNRAEIQAQLGRQVQVGAATIEEVVAMTRSNVDPRLIQNYVRTSGVARPLTASDVIYLNNAGVSVDVIQAMQNPPTPVAPAPIVAQAPPVVVQEHYYAPPPYYGPYWGHRYCGPPAGVSWGVSVAR